MVEVFKTNVRHKKAAQKITTVLKTNFPDCQINFDLDDCDRILRIESEKVIPVKVAEILKAKGFLCEVLE